MVMQADGNGSGAYMHSGIRGGPHVGALRRCSFTKTESNSKRSLRASPESPPAGLASQQILKVTLLPSALQLLRPEFFRTPRWQNSYPRKVRKGDGRTKKL